MIDRQEVMRIADLARLELSAEEIDAYRQDLVRFLNSIAKLKKADKLQEKEFLPEAATSAKVPLRVDQVGTSLKQEQVLAGAPSVEEGFFRVPRLVEEEK